jgi:FdhD protein
MVRSRRDVLRVVPCRNPKGAAEGSILNLFLSDGSGFDPDRLTRHFMANSSCGMCGRSSLESVLRDFEPLRPSAFRVDRKVLLRLPEKLGKAQAAFRRTGGLHAAALFDARGRLAVLREDVGRHNALDKVAGWGVLRSRVPFDRGVLLVSGRVSFEIMQKSIALGAPIVAAIGAPSSLAVSFARKSGQTLVGFLSDRGMNLYANPRRVVG